MKSDLSLPKGLVSLVLICCYFYRNVSKDSKETMVTLSVGQVSYSIPASTITYLLCNDRSSQGSDDEKGSQAHQASMLFCGKIGPKGDKGPPVSMLLLWCIFIR